MDIATFLGVLSAFGLLSIAIVSRGDLSFFFNVGSMVVDVAKPEMLTRIMRNLIEFLPTNYRKIYMEQRDQLIR